MEILPLGHASFKLRGKQATVVTDPYDGTQMSVKFPKHVEADIVTVSHDHYDHNAVSLVGGAPFIIRGPGEYEIKGVSIIGIATYHDEEEGNARGRNTIYRIEIDGVKIGHAGYLGHTLTSASTCALVSVTYCLFPWEACIRLTRPKQRR